MWRAFVKIPKDKEWKHSSETISYLSEIYFLTGVGLCSPHPLMYCFSNGQYRFSCHDDLCQSVDIALLPTVDVTLRFFKQPFSWEWINSTCAGCSQAVHSILSQLIHDYNKFHKIKFRSPNCFLWCPSKGESKRRSLSWLIHSFGSCVQQSLCER